ncbi:cytochrome c [Pelagibacterium halotolerans]|uniref:Cytochrome c n=1 Tax=Pelagibacterium halotolerans (strain DSM 22347 / JCM 15775 / CGMCC 1.7692 / B2) TaxID=1082931 RepID=G4R730_PELHB|nr:cytochrome c [Pelagibacterium halotolerans]AEQ50184.1 hypothetical protein KKY_137 [Pelagibacterium halotolerans B2]QJR19810.1 cytochrome c [Pelagibacterium halotolerans]SEA50015.1 Cytochrome C' [Pelagibacterium halotolerans]
MSRTSYFWGVAGACILACTTLSAATAQQAMPPTSTQAVLARQDVMVSLETLLQAVEISAGDEAARSVNLSRTGAISAMLGTVPFLFPQASSPDALGAEADAPVTSADPAIWDNLEAFVSLNASASQVARDAAQAETVAALQNHTTALRAACTACHEQYLTYVSPFSF